MKKLMVVVCILAFVPALVFSCVNEGSKGCELEQRINALEERVSVLESIVGNASCYIGR